jgi:mannose-6-phosphate isomerase-like protein (cupin superfamily)
VSETADPVGQPLPVVRTAPATANRRQLRNGRGEVVDVVGPAQGSRLDIHVNEIRAGAGPGPYHLHTNAENFFFVLEGRVRMRLDGEAHDLGPGDSVWIPPGVAHDVAVVDDGAARLVEIYAPAEPDFVLVPE